MSEGACRAPDAPSRRHAATLPPGVRKPRNRCSDSIGISVRIRSESSTTIWQHDLSGGLRMLRIGIDVHAISSHFVLPLLIRRTGGLVVEMTDGTAEYNVGCRHREGFYYDLVKAAAGLYRAGGHGARG